MSSTIKYLQSLASPARFRDALLVPTAAGPKRLGEIAADFQRRDFAAIDLAMTAMLRGKPLPRRGYWLERTKGGSKDSDVAVCLLYLLAYSPRALRIQIGAYDQQQADEIRLIVRQILNLDGPLNRALSSKGIRFDNKPLIQVQLNRIIGATDDIYAEILTTDSRGTHGSRPDAVVVNELSHIGNEEFAQTLLDNADKTGGLAIIATNAGHLDSWQYRWRELYRTSPRWHFSALATPAPWVSEADLAESRVRNPPHRFARLWGGQWVADGGDALEADDLRAAINRPGPLAEPEKGWVYAGGLDIGLKHDYSAFVILGKYVGWAETIEKESDRPPLPPALTAAVRQWPLFGDEPPPPLPAEYETVYHKAEGQMQNRLRLAKVFVWKPSGGRFGQVEFSTVESSILNESRRFGIEVLAADPTQAAQLLERLRGKGIRTREVPFTAGNLDVMASDMLAYFREQRIDLFDHTQLVADLRVMRIVEKQQHKLRLEFPRSAGTGHGDCGTALAIAMLGARELLAVSRQVEGELLCWP